MRTIYNIATGEITVDPDFVSPVIEAPPTVPQSITRRQGRLALLQAGMLDAVEQIMANPETPRAVRITYEDATEWWRGDAMIAEFAAALDLTDAQVDALFVQAAAL